LDQARRVEYRHQIASEIKDDKGTIPFTSIYIHLHPFANSRVESQGLNLLSTWMYLVIEAVTGPAFEPAAFTVVFALDVGTLTLFKQQNGD